MMRRNFLARTRGRRFLIFGKGGKMRTRPHLPTSLLKLFGTSRLALKNWWMENFRWTGKGERGIIIKIGWVINDCF